MHAEGGALDLRALQARLCAIADERKWAQFHTPKNLVMALSVEVAELVEIFQWMTPDESAALTKNRAREVADEIADVAIFLVRLADVTGIDLPAAVHRKLESDQQRTPGERGWVSAPATVQGEDGRDPSPSSREAAPPADSQIAPPLTGLEELWIQGSMARLQRSHGGCERDSGCV